MNWSNYRFSHIFVANIENGKLTGDKDIMPGEAWDAPLAPNFDGAEISWSPDGKNTCLYIKKNCMERNML